MKIFTPRQSVEKAYLKDKAEEMDIRHFRDNLKVMLNEIKPEESEEYNKNTVIKFLATSLYSNSAFRVNTYGKTDLAIYKGEHPAVLFEFKGPGRPDMVTKEDLSKKSMYELVLYYLREELGERNNDITHLVITNCTQYFVFEKKVFYQLFAKDKKFVQRVLDADRAKSDNNEYIYNQIIKPKVDEVVHKFEFTYIDLGEFRKELVNDDILRKPRFIAAYKFFSPIHLLRLTYNNDHNTLDSKFYRELLYIMGVEEKVKDNVYKIVRIGSNRQSYSLVEQAFQKLEDYDDLPSEEERFDKALGLVLIWINRILFLKLLESQLASFNPNEKAEFLDIEHIPGYDELRDLFFEVLAKPMGEREMEMKEKFPMVPYLNSSLFELSDIEKKYFGIGQLRHGEIEVYPQTVAKDIITGKRLKGKQPLLKYLFTFLSSYDFGAEKSDDILRTQSKTIINASVLGLIFEKINGYKDGAFFTPGYITEYICSTTIRRAVVNKFNEAKGWHCTDFEELKDCIDTRREGRMEANDIINSIRICDPAVGSGHFLVSALNEIIAIKSELQILQDHEEQPKAIRDWNIKVEDDELVVFDEDGNTFAYDPKSPEKQRVQKALFEEKRTIIENCLFGVDLNPKSVNICRLRLWIELLKNAYYDKDEAGNRELQTLPNIDINIKVGDSLFSKLSVAIGHKLGNSEITKRSIEQYKINVAKYKNTSDKFAKYRIKDSIKGLKAALFNPQQDLFEDNSSQQQDSLKISKSMEWAIEFPDVIDNDSAFTGFDIIIGNPPYISLEKLKSEAKVYGKMRVKPDPKKPIHKTYSTLEGRGDIYSLFVERGLQLLKRGGQLSFIMPNKWTKVMYGRPLRSLFLKNNLTDIVDFGNNQIFDDATTYTCIVSMTNEPSKGEIAVSQIEELHPKTLADDIDESREIYNAKDMDDGIWFISSLANFKKVKALQANMITLDSYVGSNSYRGILPGLTKVFKISKEEYGDFVSSDEHSRNLLRPFLQGKGMRSFIKPEAESYLLFIPKGFTLNGMGIADGDPKPSEEEAWQWFSENYPAAANRFMPYINQAKSRTDKGDYWWELRACSYYDKFDEPKIFYQAFQVKPCFVYDDSSYLCNNSMFFLSVHDKALLSLLCSEVGWWLIGEFCPRIQNGHQLIWDNFRQIPIPQKLPSEWEDLANELMEALSAGNSQRFEEKMAELNTSVRNTYH